MTRFPSGNQPKLSRFLNRELSWLAFNDRVLEEAQDFNYPLLERLKYIAIVSSNLDEFFMIRVAGLEEKLKKKRHAIEDDGTPTLEVLSRIREWVLAQKAKQGTVLLGILDRLREQGLYLQTLLSPQDTALIENAKMLIPDVKVQFFKSADALPPLESGKIYVFVRLVDQFSIVSWPESLGRLILLPENVARFPNHYILAEKLIAAAASQYFSNQAVLETFPFKVIRDADLKIDPNTDPEELLETVEEAIQKRARMPVVRLEVDSAVIPEGALIIAKYFKLSSRSVYRYDVPLDLKILWRIHRLSNFAHLCFPTKTEKKMELEDIRKYVASVREKDILLHHPYDSFDAVVNLLKAAANDKDVFAIRQTLYRTGADSEVVTSLKRASQNGKRVSVFVELRARFDEAQNVQLAKDLKKAGVRVLKGFPDKKIHCKLTQILRKEEDEVTSFVHVGTGNYNPSTAKLYTDLGLLTVDKGFGRDAEKVFKFIQNERLPRRFESFVSAPIQLHRMLLKKIRNEMAIVEGGGQGHIIIKVNALVDTRLTEALYEASNAGVKIDLIVRGACVLRPGVPGMSENIRVISIVDKYLEHSRIYYFKNSEFPQVYLSSADWMPRNLHNRIEIAFPINDPDLKAQLRNVVLEAYLKDNQKARQLLPDGRWVRLVPPQDGKPFSAQSFFESGLKGF